MISNMFTLMKMINEVAMRIKTPYFVLSAEWGSKLKQISENILIRAQNRVSSP